MLKYFVDGGIFMYPILFFLIFGVAFSLAKIIQLAIARTNTKKFIGQIRKALMDKGIEAARQICVKTPGPVASIFHAGLLRYDRGMDVVEQAVSNAGGLEQGVLARGLVWINTSISLAPMIGFTGTVAGMIGAFDSIKKANDVSASIVAGDISVALLTTAFGLITAMVCQFMYNFIVSQMDRIVADMEHSAVELIDVLLEVKDKENK